MSRQTRLYSIDSIQLSMNEADPPQLVVTAIGQATTSGWNDIALEPLESELSPDRILDLALVGTPPADVVFPALVPAIAHFVWTEAAERVIGVTVHARTNTLTQLVAHQGQQSRQFTTLALGEEGGHQVPAPPPPPPGPQHGGFTTLALGEEGGQQVPAPPPQPWPQPGPQHGGFTTLALGEEGPSPTQFAGEHGGPPGPFTTLALGEEHHPTTMVGGEEGPTHFLGEGPTFFPGEHGPSLPIAEHPSTIVAEHGPRHDPGDWAQQAGNPFGHR